jgi:L-Ala-D/L-Glu epimerase
MRIHLEKRHLDLKVNWKLSRNQTTFKENFIVTLETDWGNFRSEIAPNIRYGETPDKIQSQFSLWAATTPIANLTNSGLLEVELNKSTLFHSLRFGIESAFLHAYAAKEGKTLSAYLNLPNVVPVSTSFSMPITPISEIRDYLKPLSRFESLKIKVDSDSGLDMLKEIHGLTSAKLRVDGNEAWKDFDQFMKFHESLKGMNIELIEQPFPSTMGQEYRELKKFTPYTILADESIEDVGDFSELSNQFHAVNIKLMKTGSLIKARDLILNAKANKMKAMIGCMIETSIGISYGMLFGGMVDYVDLDGFLLVKDEPFHLVTEAEGILTLI